MNITMKIMSKYMSKEDFIDLIDNMLTDYCKKYKNNPVEPWAIEDGTFTIRDLNHIVNYCKVDGEVFSVEQFIHRLKSWQKAKVFDLMIQGNNTGARKLMIEYIEDNPFSWQFKIQLVQFIEKNNIREAVEKYADLLY